MKGYTDLYVKRRLVQLETDILGIITKNMIDIMPKRPILFKIKRKITSVGNEIGLTSVEMNHIWAKSLSKFNKIYKETAVTVYKFKEDQQKKNEVLYKSIRNGIYSESITKESNEVMYNYEQRMKYEGILGKDGLIENAISPFFLASSHPKPAKDHEKWEGKCYYDENWEEKGDYSDQEKASIRAYIRNHKLNTIQFVTGDGIWLGLRKNCKHFFKNVPLNEVLSSSVRSMLKKHGMIHEESKVASYQVLQYRKYYNRLKELLELEKNIPNKLLENDIKKTRMVLNKWKKAL